MDPESPLGKEGQTELEKPVTKSPEQAQYEHERDAFVTHMTTSGEAIPENFKDAGAYFDSLKEAHKQFTQAKQEIAELKKKQEVEKTEPSEPLITNELRIPKIEKAPEPEKPVKVNDDLYEKWSTEFITTGAFSDETKTEIKSLTGFTDRMLNDYMEGQKAKMREGFGKAAAVVGGQDTLNKIFKWASQNLTAEELANVNMGLASPTYEVTLRGLAALYSERVQKIKEKEPAKNTKLTQVASSQTGILPFENQREFKAARSDPQFQYDAKYRDIVQKRMSITDWNTLPR